MLKIRWTVSSSAFEHQLSGMKLGFPATILPNHGLLSLKRSQRPLMLRSNAKNMNKIVCNSSTVQPAGSAPSSSCMNRKGWILGLVISVILPFWKSKWGPLLAIKKEVDMVVQNVENVAEIVEEVAEKVEEVADDIADQLSQDGKLHDAVRLVESIAKKTAKDADLVDDLIDKAQEVEEKLENLLEPVLQDQEEKEVEHEPINAENLLEPVLQDQEEKEVEHEPINAQK